MHAKWDYGSGFDTNFQFNNGLRPDAINFKTNQIIELKPNSPSGQALGKKQLQGYMDQANKQFPGRNWTGGVEYYNP